LQPWELFKISGRFLKIGILPFYINLLLHTRLNLSRTKNASLAPFLRYSDNMNKKKILIVEDHPDTRQLLALVLMRSGYEVIEAGTGLGGIEQARVARPDLILMDLGLPGMKGDEAIARIKEDLCTRDIPIIVSTAFHRQSVLLQHAIELGIAEILYKPINFLGLQETVNRYLAPTTTSDLDRDRQPLTASEGSSERDQVIDHARA